MPYNVLLLPLLGGFLFIRFWNRTSWYIIRADKDRLIIYASLSGLTFLCLAFAARSIPPFIPCASSLPCLPTWWSEHIGIPYSGVSFFALLLGATLWYPLNSLPPFKRRWGKEEEAKRILVEQGSTLIQLLDRAMKEEQTLLLTMKTGKIYVGFIRRFGAPGSPQEKEIEIIPTRSGYRDEKQRVNLTTNYAKVWERIEADIEAATAQRKELLSELKLLRAANAGGSPPDELDLQSPLDDTRAWQAQLESDADTLTEKIEMLEDALTRFGIVIPVEQITAASFYITTIDERYFTDVTSPPSDTGSSLAAS
jgi:hypothetical protein